jgi:hypothetical protein
VKRKFCTERETKKRLQGPRGGYRSIATWHLCLAYWTHREGLIRALDLRVWFAAQERTAGIEADQRARGRTPSKTPEIPLVELVRQIGGGGGGEARVRNALRRLARIGLIQNLALGPTTARLSFLTSPDQLSSDRLPSFWEMLDGVPNHQRKIPVPRRVLRTLAAWTRRALIATTLGALIRCLYHYPRDGVFAPTGAFKCSWVSQVFGLHVSRVKEARAHLLELGWLLPAGDSTQLELNAHGRWFTINLDWARPHAARRNGGASTSEQPPGTTGAVESPGSEAAPAAVPLPAEKVPPAVPPKENKNPRPTDERSTPNHGGAAPEPPGSGFCKSRTGPKTPRGAPPPTWARILPEDLVETERLLGLFDQAKARGLVSGSDADRLAFIGAAERARLRGTTNPPGFFRRVVERRLFSHITADDEEAARRRLSSYLHGERRGGAETGRRAQFSAPGGAFRSEERPLTDDARFALAVRRTVAQKGYRGDPLLLVQSRWPEWTQERWVEAQRALDERSQLRAGNSVGELLAGLRVLEPREASALGGGR